MAIVLSRHPPFSTWLMGLASQAGILRYVAVYLVGQLLALTAVIVTVLFMRRVAGGAAARVTLLVLLACYFIAYVPIQGGHSLGLMPFWQQHWRQRGLHLRRAAFATDYCSAWPWGLDCGQNMRSAICWCRLALRSFWCPNGGGAPTHLVLGSHSASQS